MNERERAILRGKSIVPQTADEAALKYAIDHAGGGDEPSYEVVAEIEVGEMTESEGMMMFTSDVPFPAIDGQIYFNSVEYPLALVDGTGGSIFAYNYDSDNNRKEDPAKPLYLFVGMSNGGGEAVCVIGTGVDDADLSNTTVRILKAASEPSGGGKLVVHLTESEEGGETIYSADKTVAQILAADAAGQVVECVKGNTDTGDMRLALVFIQENTVIFGVQGGDSGGISSVFATGTAKDGDDDEWSWGENYYRIPSNLKPTYEFGFTLQPKGGGGFDVLPDSGVTYAAISAAIEETSNIKAVGHVNGEDIYLSSYLVGSDYVTFDGAIYMGESIGWTCVRLVIDDSSGAAVYISPISTT